MVKILMGAIDENLDAGLSPLSVTRSPIFSEGSH